MRKLIESSLVSLDGVIESPERWAIFDDEATQLSMQELDNYEAFIMGRVTFERFRDNRSAGGNPYLDRIGAMPKFVASRSLAEVTWNATLLGPDIVRAIQDLKAQPGKDLIKYRNSRLDATLLRAARRRTPRLDHARRRRQRPTHFRGRRDQVAQANPHRRPQATQRLGRPHLHTRLTAARTQ